MEFNTFGPFEVRKKSGSDIKDDLTSFFELIDEKHPGLSSASGVYVLCKQNGNAAPKPWYVGRTTASRGFKGRFWEHYHNDFYARLNETAPNGKLVGFLLARMNAGGRSFRTARASDLKSINMLEFLLIGACLTCNESLLNASEKAFHRGFHVPGYLNKKPGKPNKAAQAFAEMLNS